MSGIEELLRLAGASFDALRLPWALVGGLAVSVRTEPRFTRDIDVAAAVTGDTAAEAVIRGFRDHGFHAATLVEHEATKRLATVRLSPPSSTARDLMLDVLFASSGIEPEVCAAAERIEVFPGLVVPVATSAHLLALKILARDDRTRPQDAADIRQLVEGMDAEALAAARAACRLIASRGFNRARDLQQALDVALREWC